jgi:hypothetical protein
VCVCVCVRGGGGVWLVSQSQQRGRVCACASSLETSSGDTTRRMTCASRATSHHEGKRGVVNTCSAIKSRHACTCTHVNVGLRQRVPQHAHGCDLEVVASEPPLRSTVCSLECFVDHAHLLWLGWRRCWPTHVPFVVVESVVNCGRWLWPCGWCCGLVGGAWLCVNESCNKSPVVVLWPCGRCMVVCE